MESRPDWERCNRSDSGVKTGALALRLGVEEVGAGRAGVVGEGARTESRLPRALPAPPAEAEEAATGREGVGEGARVDVVGAGEGVERLPLPSLRSAVPLSVTLSAVPLSVVPLSVRSSLPSLRAALSDPCDTAGGAGGGRALTGPVDAAPATALPFRVVDLPLAPSPAGEGDLLVSCPFDTTGGPADVPPFGTTAVPSCFPVLLLCHQ